MNYLANVLVIVEIYAVVGLSLNLVLGLCGRLLLCQAMFYGIGAYGTAILTVKLQWGLAPAFGAAFAAGVAVAFLIGSLALRLRADHFVLTTLSVQIAFFAFMHNLISITGGPEGLSGIPRPTFLRWSPSSPAEFLAFTTSLALFALLVHWQLARSPYGRALRAIRDNTPAAALAGKSEYRFQLSALAYGGGIAAAAGALFASFSRHIDATDFDLNESVSMLAVVIIGGAGRSGGPLLGALVLIAVPEALQLAPLRPGLEQALPPLRLALFGLAMIMVMRFRRQGLLGDYRFD